MQIREGAVMGQVVEAARVSGSLGIGCRLPAGDAAMTARRFLDDETRREAVMRDLRAVMADRRVQGGETALLGLVMALALGEIRATLLSRATRNASYGLSALVRGGWLEPVDGRVVQAGRRMRWLRLTARGEEAALALVEVLARHGEGFAL